MMAALLRSALLADGELTNQLKWYYRVFRPVSDRLTALLGDSGWVTVATFTNSWVSYGAPFAAPAYRVRDGVLYLRGALKSGSNTPGTNTAFTLPAGYRLAVNEIFLVPAGPIATPGCARMNIFATGEVQVETFFNGATNAYVDLANLHGLVS